MKSVNATNAVAVVLGGLGVALELVAPFQTVGAAVGEVVHRKRRRGDAHLVQVCAAENVTSVATCAFQPNRPTTAEGRPALPSARTSSSRA
jgi:hypothetical protein